MRLFAVVMVALSVLLSGCSGKGGLQGEPLRVGVMADYPPLVFHQDGQLAGLEVDFARQLGEDLGRPVTFQEYGFAGLFRALDSGEIDIIMSGVSVTAERQRHYLFSLPYTTIGQMAMIRLDDAARLSTPGALFHSQYRVGYKSGTTGEAFVLSRVDVKTVGFDSNDEATEALVEGDIDVYIHDAPTVWNLANRHEYPVKLLGLYKPLTQEPLAWVMRKDNMKLKSDVDEVLKAWMNNGELMRMKHQWIPVKILSGE